MARYCAFTTVAFMIALIVEAAGYVLTREGKSSVPCANQGAKARAAGLRSVASRAERGEEGLRLPRLLFAGTRMDMYCVGIIAFSTFANSVLEGAFAYTTTTDIAAKCVETIAESAASLHCQHPQQGRPCRIPQHESPRQGIGWPHEHEQKGAPGQSHEMF